MKDKLWVKLEEQTDWIVSEYETNPDLQLYKELKGEDFIDLTNYIIGNKE